MRFPTLLGKMTLFANSLFPRPLIQKEHTVTGAISGELAFLNVTLGAIDLALELCLQLEELY